MSRLNRWLVLKGRKKKKTRKEKNQKGKKPKKKSPKETNGRFVAVLNHTRFERITFRSGVERATVAPAVLIEKFFAYLVLSISQVFPPLVNGRVDQSSRGVSRALESILVAPAAS